MTTTLFAREEDKEEDKEDKEEEAKLLLSRHSSSPPLFLRDDGRKTLNVDRVQHTLTWDVLKKELRCVVIEVILCANNECEMFKKGGIANNECEMFFKALLLRENGEV